MKSKSYIIMKELAFDKEKLRTLSNRLKTVNYNNNYYIKSIIDFHEKIQGVIYRLSTNYIRMLVLRTN